MHYNLVSWFAIITSFFIPLFLTILQFHHLKNVNPGQVFPHRSQQRRYTLKNEVLWNLYILFVFPVCWNLWLYLSCSSLILSQYLCNYLLDTHLLSAQGSEHSSIHKFDFPHANATLLYPTDRWWFNGSYFSSGSALIKSFLENLPGSIGSGMQSPEATKRAITRHKHLKIIWWVRVINHLSASDITP